MNENTFIDKLEQARTPTEVLRLIHIELPKLPVQAHSHYFPMAYGKLEAVACTGEEGCRGQTPVVHVDDMR